MVNTLNRKGRVNLSREEIAEIKIREANGETKAAISRALNISRHIIYKHTKLKVKQDPDSVKAKALELIEKGFSRVQISKSLGVSKTWLRALIPVPGKKIPSVPENVKEELLSRVKSGEIAAHVARDLGIHPQTASQIIKADAELPNEEIIVQIKEQKSLGKTYLEISKNFQIPVFVLRRVLSDKRPKCRKYTDTELLGISQLYSQGLSAREVCIEFDCSEGIVNQIYKAMLKQGLVEPRIELAMEDDRELTKILRRYPQLAEWQIYAVQWLKIVLGNYLTACVTVHKFLEYVIDHSLFLKPADFFLKTNAKFIPNYFDVVCPKSDHGANLNNLLMDFFDWVLVQPEFADVTEEGFPTTFPMFRNPLNRVSRGEFRAVRSAESTKKVMPYWMIHDLRRRIAEGPNFGDWKWTQKTAGLYPDSSEFVGRDWFEVPEERIDKSDPDCVWRLRPRLDGVGIFEMWSPVRWVACLIKLQTTGRMGQIRMLDSGEADTFIYKNGIFVLNQSSLALGTVRKPRRQGALRQAEENSVCLYFNTNKTADTKNTGPDKGMECPWPSFPDYQDNPYYWIEKLRDWQAKYNPVESAISWSDVPSSRRLKGKSEIASSTYPDAVFLFRTPESEGKNKQFPVASFLCDRAWQVIMAGYEQLLDLEGKTNPDFSKIIFMSNGRSQISLHGLRVSLITHLILDGGVPPILMMKIVGHARFIMTLYYTKPGLQRIEDALVEAASKLDATKDETLVRDLKTRSAEQIRDHVVFNANDVLDVLPLNTADRNPIGWLPMHDGICLAGGNTAALGKDSRYPGCHNGGALIDETRTLYGPAPGGIRNCSRCRWKCAGKQHALGLQATFNNRQYHLHKASELAINAERERNLILKDKASIESFGQPFTRANDLRAAERKYELAMHKMQELALDVTAIFKMIERIKALPENPDGPTALAAQGDLNSLQSVMEDTDSELLVLAGVCAEVELFPDLEAGTAIFEYAQLLDQAFEREGQPLILARMSEQEILAASNAIMRELERYAYPESSFLGRRKVVEIMDRGESLERSLGISLKNVIHNANIIDSNQPTLRIVAKKMEIPKDGQYPASR
ncbi:VPA1269 family protein [Methylophilus sp. Leaf414]|uniref:gamma-mobile-trio integrase GmtZ n=1 Tax=Methylophilus sp. Leaf414 TaxID=1736371 RepID=UPI0006FC6B07|nr:VPA1269 family protein [Methylophilus sp. Leaf414]KQT34143.1 hypothetical protein ASG24_10360 [Methylophilus sp. Leaf414]